MSHTRPTLTGPLLVLLLLLAALALSACGEQTRSHAIFINEGRRFSPATLTVRVDEPVIWHNRSPDRHHILVDAAPSGALARLREESAIVRSGDLFHSQQWTHSFSQPGVYRFASALYEDEDMLGIVTVEE
jgi:plastocyanin